MCVHTLYIKRARQKHSDVRKRTSRTKTEDQTMKWTIEKPGIKLIFFHQFIRNYILKILFQIIKQTFVHFYFFAGIQASGFKLFLAHATEIQTLFFIATEYNHSNGSDLCFIQLSSALISVRGIPEVCIYIIYSTVYVN